MSNGKKTRGVGRPALPKGHAKARIVPVRVKSRRLERMNSAARVSKKTLSTWIRGVVKKELKRGGFMTEYEQQIESGKEIVLGMLAKFATKLDYPKVKELAFHVSGEDFDHDCISLVDPKLHVVTRIQEDDFADCPADARVRGRIETQLQQAIRAFYGRKT